MIHVVLQGPGACSNGRVCSFLSMPNVGDSIVVSAVGQNKVFKVQRVTHYDQSMAPAYAACLDVISEST